MRRLPENQRWLAIGLLQGGSTQADVARQLNVSQSVISRLWNHQQQTGNVTDIHRVGRPRATTRQQDRLLVTSVLRNRHQNATQLQRRLYQVTGVQVSTQTVRNRLHDRGLNARRPYIVLPLRARHRRARRDWARQYQASGLMLCSLTSHGSCWTSVMVDNGFGGAGGGGVVGVGSDILMQPTFHIIVMEVAV